ncbi:alpha-crystallin domain-containing protein [Bordetella sp. 2513F-2]
MDQNLRISGHVDWEQDERNGLWRFILRFERSDGSVVRQIRQKYGFASIEDGQGPAEEALRKQGARIQLELEHRAQ